MTKLLVCNSRKLLLDKPDTHCYNNIQNLYHRLLVSINPLDRSNTIKPPYHFDIKFPLPKFRNFNKSYYDICIDRAVELNNLSYQTKKPIIILWSGGIDSTTAITAFLQSTNNYDHIQVALNGSSLSENYKFYKRHILKKFKIISSDMVFDRFNLNNIIVGGEFNDQLFGEAFIEKLEKYYTLDVAKSNLNPDLIIEFFVRQNLDKIHATKWFELLKNSIDSYNSNLVTSNFDFLWWYNFTHKWQHVYFRTLLSCDSLSKDFLDNNYKHFFDAEQFQLWSMNNPDKKIGNSWQEYKKVAKDIIFDYTKDQDYYDNKVKVGSLYHILTRRKTSPIGITDDLKFIYDIDVEKYYNSDNSFI